MQDILTQLKRRFGNHISSGAAIAASVSETTPSQDSIDEMLRDGFAGNCLHEVFANQTADIGATTGFVASLTRPRCHKAKQIVWVRQAVAESETGRLNVPGLAAFGLNPQSLIVVRTRSPRALLSAGLEAVRCSSLGAVVIEAWGNPGILDLTATRRLALAAEKSGVASFLVRLAAAPAPSAAFTRWQVSAAPSQPLAANAPGAPTLDITLLRHRAGMAGQRWRVEWDHDRCQFRTATPLSGGMVSLAPRRSPPMAARPLARTG